MCVTYRTNAYTQAAPLRISISPIRYAHSFTLIRGLKPSDLKFPRPLRLRENKPAYMAMNWQPDNGRRRPRRPTKTWRTTFNEDLHVIGLTWPRQTEMGKARRPMFQQELEELRSKVSVSATSCPNCRVREAPTPRFRVYALLTTGRPPVGVTVPLRGPAGTH